jgi:hypothetical protein
MKNVTGWCQSFIVSKFIGFILRFGRCPTVVDCTALRTPTKVANLDCGSIDLSDPFAERENRDSLFLEAAMLVFDPYVYCAFECLSIRLFLNLSP